MQQVRENFLKWALFPMVLAVLGQLPQVVMASGLSGLRCVSAHADFSGSAEERQKLIWEILAKDPSGMWTDDLKAEAVPLSRKLTSAERVHFAERILSRPDWQTKRYVSFLMTHVLKSKSEDPIHGLTTDQLFSIFKNLSGEGTVQLTDQYKRFFPLFSVEQLRELGRILGENHASIMVDHGEQFPLTDDEIIPIWLNYARTNATQILNQSRYGKYPNPDHTAKHFLLTQAPLKLPSSGEKKILRAAFAFGALDALTSGALRSIWPTQIGTPLDAPAGQESIQNTVNLIADRYPTLIHPSEARILWDRVKDIQIGFRLLGELAKLTDRGIAIPETSLEALSLASGYDLRAVEGAGLSERQMNQLYSLSLDISYSLDRPPFEKVPIDPRLWSPQHNKDFLDLLSYLRDLSHLYGNRQLTWNQIISELGLQKGLKPETLGDIKKHTRQLTIQALEKEFQSSHISISHQELVELQEHWGSLEPIITLVARFQGNAGWRKEIPVLASVLQAALGNRFAAYKYEGDTLDSWDREMTQRQLKMLKNESAKAEWRAERTRVDLHDPNLAIAESDASRVNRAQVIVKTNLISNLRNRAQGPILQGELKQRLKSLIASSAKTPSLNDLRESVQADFGTIERTLVRLLLEVDSAPEMRRIASYLKGSFSFSSETVADLTAVVSSLTPVKAGADAIVFSTTFDHPKMLLTIGDLVETSSCQNYKTGSYIGTLLGYVIDAGVKGFASYSLKPAHFAAPREYELLSQALKARVVDSSVQVQGKLDPEKGIVHFRISQGGPSDTLIETLPLSKAQLRAVVKLGQTEQGGPGLLAERPYEQTNSARSLMMSHLAQIGNEIAVGIGGVVGQSIDVPATRNVGGVYSDQAGGVQYSSYRIKSRSEIGK